MVYSHPSLTSTFVPHFIIYIYLPQPLGHWVGRQRYLHKTNTLKPDRLEKLETIGFEFVMSKSDSVKFSVVWDQSYQALKAFKDVNGHIEVPKGYKPQPDMAELDGWVARQRSHFKKGKLPEHLKDKLVALGLNLGGRGRPFGIEAEDVWITNYKALAGKYLCTYVCISLMIFSTSCYCFFVVDEE